MATDTMVIWMGASRWRVYSQPLWPEHPSVSIAGCDAEGAR